VAAFEGEEGAVAAEKEDESRERQQRRFSQKRRVQAPSPRILTFT
jgi:hypothetical protein